MMRKKYNISIVGFIASVVTVAVLLMYLMLIFSSCRAVKITQSTQIDSTKKESKILHIEQVKNEITSTKNESVKIDTSEVITYHFSEPISARAAQQFARNYNNPNPYPEHKTENKNDNIKISKIDVRKNRIGSQIKTQTTAEKTENLNVTDSVKTEFNYSKNERITTAKNPRYGWILWVVLGIAVVGGIAWKCRGFFI